MACSLGEGVIVGGALCGCGSTQAVRGAEPLPPACVPRSTAVCNPGSTTNEVCCDGGTCYGTPGSQLCCAAGECEAVGDGARLAGDAEPTCCLGWQHCLAVTASREHARGIPVSAMCGRGPVSGM